MKDIKKKIIISVIIISGIVIIFFVGKYLTKIISIEGDKTESYSINSDDSKNRILIATQKTKFKDAVMQEVIKNFENKNVFISVIDVRQLPSIISDDWNKIIIFSAIKMYKFHPDIVKFLKNNNNNKIFMYNTSESTIMTYDEIDTITSASKNQQNVSSEIINTINNVIKQ